MLASRRKIKILRSLVSLLKLILTFFVKIIFKIRSNKYSVYISEAFYSPWTDDMDFNVIFLRIKEFTMLDKVRLYNSWSLIENIKNKEDGILIEVGTWRGGSAMLIASRLLNLKMKNKFYAFDTFEGVIKASNKDNYYKNNEHSDCNFEEVKKQITKQNLYNLKLIKGIFPDELNKDSELHDQKIIFSHIDVDTYKSAKDILNYIWNKMCSGGIIVFDDYGFHQANGVRVCLDEFVSNNKCFSHYLNTGQYLLIKL